MLELRVRNGALESAGQWVYAWIAGWLSGRQVCDPAGPAAPHPETNRFVEAIEARLQ